MCNGEKQSMNEKTQKNRIPFWRNIKVVPYLYILPNMILFLIFMIIPIFMSFYYGMGWENRNLSVLLIMHTYSRTKYSLQGTTQGNGLTGGVPPVRFSM